MNDIYATFEQEEEIDVQRLVLDNLKQIEFPEEVIIRVRTNVYGNDSLKNYSFMIDMNSDNASILTSDEIPYLTPSICDFNVFRSRGYLEAENIKMELPSMHKQGFGRTFVEMMEDIARKTNLRHVKATHCKNSNFWEHMGYRKDQDSIDTWIKKV